MGTPNNRRQPPPRTPSTSTTPPAGGSSTNGSSGTAAKPKKPRKTEDEIIAECEAKANAARERKALKAISENKPLAAAVKAAGKLRKWLPTELATAVDAHMQRLVKANATSGALADKVLGAIPDDDAPEGRVEA